MFTNLFATFAKPDTSATTLRGRLCLALGFQSLRVAPPPYTSPEFPAVVLSSPVAKTPRAPAELSPPSASMESPLALAYVPALLARPGAHLTAQDAPSVLGADAYGHPLHEAPPADEDGRTIPLPWPLGFEVDRPTWPGEADVVPTPAYIRAHSGLVMSAVLGGEKFRGLLGYLAAVTARAPLDFDRNRKSLESSERWKRFMLAHAARFAVAAPGQTSLRQLHLAYLAMPDLADAITREALGAVSAQPTALRHANLAESFPLAGQPPEPGLPGLCYGHLFSAWVRREAVDRLGSWPTAQAVSETVRLLLPGFDPIFLGEFIEAFGRRAFHITGLAGPDAHDKPGALYCLPSRPPEPGYIRLDPHVLLGGRPMAAQVLGAAANEHPSWALFSRLWAPSNFPTGRCYLSLFLTADRTAVQEELAAWPSVAEVRSTMRRLYGEPRTPWIALVRACRWVPDEEHRYLLSAHVVGPLNDSTVSMVSPGGPLDDCIPLLIDAGVHDVPAGVRRAPDFLRLGGEDDVEMVAFASETITFRAVTSQSASMSVRLSAHPALRRVVEIWPVAIITGISGRITGSATNAALAFGLSARKMADGSPGAEDVLNGRSFATVDASQLAGGGSLTELELVSNVFDLSLGAQSSRRGFPRPYFNLHFDAATGARAIVLITVRVGGAAFVPIAPTAFFRLASTAAPAAEATAPADTAAAESSEEESD